MYSLFGVCQLSTGFILQGDAVNHCDCKENAPSLLSTELESFSFELLLMGTLLRLVEFSVKR